MPLYKVVRPDGTVEYTDVPAGPGRVETVRRGEEPATAEPGPHDHQLAKTLIKEAQKRIPKVADYLNYLEYLRHNSPLKFDRVMNELRQQDPQTWLKLQKYPQFRPLRETAVGIKAGTNLLGAGVGLATGNLTGSTEKWMEGTLKDLMKRDRFGPYADVLGAKATTLPTKTPSYSSSRLGQYLKTEDARAAVAAKAAAKDLESAKEGLRSARGAAVVRPLTPLVDLGIGMLDPDKASSVGTVALRERARKLFERGVIDAVEWAEAQSLLSQGRFPEMKKLMDDAVARHAGGG